MAKKSEKKEPRSRKELNRICNIEPSRNTEKDWRFEDAVASEAIGAPLALPASVDLRASWWKINNQESTGSCVGWASADGVARYHFVKANRLTQTALLSPRFIWMASKETDVFTSRPETFIEGAGTSLKAAVDIMRSFGNVPETLLPFKITTFMHLGNPNAFFATAATRKVTAYFNLFKNLTNWRSWLVNHGPLLVALNVDATWDNATATGGKLNTFQPNTVRGGHAVAIVGYRTDGRFIVRNSWGTGWGDNGFAYPTDAYVNAAFFNESYGVTV